MRKVILRNGASGYVVGPGPTSKNVLVGGYIKNWYDSFHTRICWHSSGNWRWDDQEHELDIVGDREDEDEQA